MSKRVWSGGLVAGLLLVLGGAAPGSCRNRIQGFYLSELSPASTDAEKRSVRASDVAIVDRRPARVGWQPILRSGERVGGGELGFGELVDNRGKPILREDGSRPIADSNDFTSLLPVEGKLYSVAQFESQPGAMYLTELSQDERGTLTALRTKPIDLSSIYGIWNPCAGSVSPWGTHLGSEEYEPNAKLGQTSAASMAPYFGGGSVLGGDPAAPNPYRYGYAVEVAVSGGEAQVVKHYSMGRFAHELSYVMPDGKTVYETDDGTNVGLYMFVADVSGDLSAGKLYAAKWHQTSPAGESALGRADIEFIELGHASNAELEALIAGGIEFGDIFDSVDPSAEGTCPGAYRAVNANGVGLECLALESGAEQAAAFLETRRYSGYVGATTEFRKEEGIAFDAESGRLYVAYSEIQYGMEDNAKNGSASDVYDIGTSNDIKLQFNVCGAVYAFEVGRVDDIDSDFTLTKAQGVLAGRMTSLADPDGLDPATVSEYAEDSPFVGTLCDIDGIANPDNLSFVAGRRVLLIGEDSGDGHQNDAVWTYGLDEHRLTRVLTTPYGAETTSLYYYPKIGDASYIVTVVQHPFGETDQDQARDPGDNRSYFGVLGPLPVSLRPSERR